MDDPDACEVSKGGMDLCEPFMVGEDCGAQGLTIGKIRLQATELIKGGNGLGIGQGLPAQCRHFTDRLFLDLLTGKKPKPGSPEETWDLFSKRRNVGKIIEPFRRGH